MTETLHDKFAMAALNGLIAATTEEDVARFMKAWWADLQRAQWLAKMAFLAADAMMAERETRQASKSQADDGWIEWNGGNIPVRGSARVDVKFRNHGHSEDVIAVSLFWGHKNRFSDIVAYRVIR